MGFLVLGVTSLLALASGAQARPRETVRLQVASAKANPEAEFQAWAREHGKQYTPDEQARRFEIWKDNLEYVISYNAEHTTHWLELGPHADLSNAEYASQLLGFGGAPRAAPSAPFPYADVSSDDLPEEIDWRKEGAVTHVKNQKQCGSCWAFSTTGAIEGVNAIHTGSLEVLSEQELIDCDTKHDHGCNGGLMDTAFEWVVKNGGIDTEKDYRYHAVEGICSVNRENREVVTIDDFADVPYEDEQALKKAVAHQPVATAIQANQRAFQLYAGGVFTEECGTQLDHGVLIAGYGRENHTDFWLIKNSWGPAWGDHGYIKLEREGDDGPGKCGLQMGPSIPIKKHDNPPRPPKPAPDPPPPAPAPSPAPGPAPEPVTCDAQTECFAGTTCCCQQLFLQVCVQWACCPIPEATCCDDHIHCCPKSLPVCDVAEGRCLPKGASGRAASALLGAAWSAPMVSKVPALPRGAAQLTVEDGA